MSMKELAWLMPLLFILHDMEAIVLGMANLKLLHRHAHSFSDLIDHVFAQNKVCAYRTLSRASGMFNINFISASCASPRSVFKS